MAHNQQASIDCKDGVDKFPMDEVMKTGAFIRVDGPKVVTVLTSSDKMAALQKMIREKMNPVEEAAAIEAPKPAAAPAPKPAAAPPAKPA